ncbi:lung seven transmembrane receptor-domain-containing protein [Globomyces pollinis-pini]|nr:lung seven transmembrane receptor-domain-containing protein [Globomyces pollinis-pini]
MYGADSIPWFKKRDSHIVVNVVPYSSSGSIALAVFRFEDRNHFESSPIHANYHICTKAAIQKNHCNATQLGSYILNNFTTSDYVGPFLNTAVHWNYTMNVNFLTAVGKRDNITESNIPVANGSDISAVEQLSEPKNTTTPLNTTKTDNISKAVSETNSTTTSGTNSTISNAANSTQINQQNSTVTTSPELIRQISPLEFYYPVVSNGLYCVLVEVDEFDSEDYADYSVDMNIGSPYGKLPAIFFPALPYFASLLSAYVLIAIGWMFTSFLNRKELLPIQNLIGAMILFLVVEQSINLGFFMDFNENGFVSKKFLGIMVTVSAARNSLSFFLLLIVSLGYGVVHPTLGKKMWSCVFLTLIHFIFGALYFTNSMLTKNLNSFFAFLVGAPLAISMFIFYVWILLSITHTIEYLESRRQSVKLLMYNRLSTILTVSITMIFFIFLVNSINLLFRNNPVWIATQWRWRWLLLDGCLNTNYFLTFISIAWLWVPTNHNSRLALEQLDSDDMDNIDDLETQNKLDGDEQVLEWAQQKANEGNDNATLTDYKDNQATETLFSTEELIEKHEKEIEEWN